MGLLVKLRNFLFRPRIANCCGCNGKDITVEVWEGKDEGKGYWFSSIHCDTCGRERITYSHISEDDAVNRIIDQWNDEMSFWKYHTRQYKKHHSWS